MLVVIEPGRQDRPFRRSWCRQDRGHHGAHQQHRHEPRWILRIRRSGWHTAVCMYVLVSEMYVCMYVGVGERTREGNDLYHEMIEGGKHHSRSVCMYVCVFNLMYVCMYVCKRIQSHVCMYVCM